MCVRLCEREIHSCHIIPLTVLGFNISNPKRNTESLNLAEFEQIHPTKKIAYNSKGSLVFRLPSKGSLEKKVFFLQRKRSVFF